MQTGSFLLSENTRQRDYLVMGLIGIAHAMSHFCQLVLPLLLPWITADFNITYAQASLALSIFYGVSCLVQTTSGFVVDQRGGRPVLLFGLVMIVLGLVGYAISTNLWMLMAAAVVLGFGNGVFHPADYTLMNKLVRSQRIGRAYSIHGISGNLGWALTPLLVPPVAIYTGSWQVAALSAAVLVALVLLMVFIFRKNLDEWVEDVSKARKDTPGCAEAEVSTGAPTGSEPALAFLKLPSIWLCLVFFFFFALSNSAIQNYAAVAVTGLFGFAEQNAGFCVTVYMLASAVGMLWGGVLASDPSKCERIVGVAFGCAAAISLILAFVPLAGLAVFGMFALMGFSTGIAGPSRDLIVKRATPPGASGRVFGFVYAGLDIGQFIAPMLYARFIDLQYFSGLFMALAAVQAVLIASAFNVKWMARK